MQLDFLKRFEFFVGVPDSQLRPVCDYLMQTYGIGDRHIIAANEGNAVALAAGYHLATGKTPVVYLQNSGIGNIINPVASLMNDKVYGIPCVFLVGWRGEPGVHDEPQHRYQGEVTVKLLEDMDIATMLLSRETGEAEVIAQLDSWGERLAAGKQVAFIVKKGALEYKGKLPYANESPMRREDIIREIASAAGEDIIVSATGKASRELFEIREQNGQSHCSDFLTVGSMGHSSSIALGIALRKPDKRVWCLDGDGAMLMHMGSLAVIGAYKPDNYVHVLINNGAHESVGGMPTVAGHVNWCDVVKGCGYTHVFSVRTPEELEASLAQIKSLRGLCFLEVKAAIGARDDLGRPTLSPQENKDGFMSFLAL